MQYKQGTIETSYSTETYFFIYDETKTYPGTTFVVMDAERQLDDFLADICYCDDYEIIKIKDASDEQIKRYEDAMQHTTHTLNACLYAKGWYENIEEMLKDQ